ncbi:hypothetical protein Tco_1556103 [Tanacetum coccineum]
MSDEPLGDDTKPRSYDVTFLNPLFYFNDDFTLCKDNPLFDEEFEDISSLDPPELTTFIDEPTLIVTLPLSCTDILGDAIIDIDLLLGESTKTSDLFEELIAEISLDDSILIGIDDMYYDSEEAEIRPLHLDARCCSRLKGGGNNNNNVNPRLIKVCYILSVRTPDVAAFKKVKEISEVEIRLLALVG